MKEIFDGVPKLLGVYHLPVEEYFTYTYLPIKLIGQPSITVEHASSVVAQTRVERKTGGGAIAVTVPGARQ